MAQTAKNQPGPETAAYAQAKLEELIRSGGRYGVPVRVIRPDDLGMPHKLQPGRYQVHGRTGRVYINGLTTREQEFLENSMDMLTRKDGNSRHHRILGDNLKSAWVRVTGYGGAYTLSLPPDTTPADKRGRGNYREKNLSVIAFSHSQTGKDEWIGMLTGDDKSVDPDALPGTAAHWAYWVLEHEMAHTSGAGEAQADIMGAAHYIKAFGKDDVPRTVSDIRAVNAVLRHASESYSEEYGWKPVAALDELLDKGAAAIKNMDDARIHDLRFRSYDGQRTAVDHFAGALLHKQGGLLHSLGIKGLIHLTEDVMAGTQLDARPGAREIGQRFLLALRRLTGTPGLHAVMKSRKKRKSGLSPGS